VNNTVYYSYFDTVVNRYLIDYCGLVPFDNGSGIKEEKEDTDTVNPIGLVAETNCSFYKSISFPDVLEAGLVVKKLGRTSGECPFKIDLIRDAYTVNVLVYL